MTSSVREKMMKIVKEKKLLRRSEMQKPVKKEMVRARDDKGHFVKDDPTTPENEAWVEKTVKAVKKTVTKKKPAAKKSRAKKV